MKLQAILLFVITATCSNSICANSRPDMVVTLTDTLYGEVDVDILANKIRLRNDKTYQCLIASQVRWIRKNDRDYCVAAFGVESSFLIFEVLSTGTKSLLYREGVKFNPYDEATFPPFFVLNDRSAYSVSTRKDVLSVFGTDEKELKDFAKVNDLSFSNKQDLSLLFDHYNESQ